ncbi:alpha/beta hydrolase [Halorussus halobius]|uniref:alpha/beta hydrolase n=1 Tax=Halorussus halobius TaxID=1710537 RepID=UPI001092D6E2|nr:CocE/NonD family hydrolase [Halorussus halobius]
MDSTDLLVPGGRDVRATLDEPEDTDPTAIVVACPPHPQHGGHRGDQRLVAASEALTAQGVACLRFDYGDWDEGYGEREDARNAVRWARDRYDRVGAFGFSFGGAMAALASASVDPRPDAVSLLAPASRLADDLDAAEALGDLDVPVQVFYGTRDDTADWEPAVEAVRDIGGEVVELEADHFFIGRHDRIGERVGAFFVDSLGR